VSLVKRFIWGIISFEYQVSLLGGVHPVGAGETGLDGAIDSGVGVTGKRRRRRHRRKTALDLLTRKAAERRISGSYFFHVDFLRGSFGMLSTLGDGRSGFRVFLCAFARASSRRRHWS
jgi:hypothetical protein